MIVVVVLGVIAVLVVAMVVSIATDPGPQPEEVAIAYERAWDRLDFGTLWALSAPELRDGRNRREFVRAKRGAYADGEHLAGHVARVEIDEVVRFDDSVSVHTRLVTGEDTTVHNIVQMSRRMGRWEVTGYVLRPTAGTG